MFAFAGCSSPANIDRQNAVGEEHQQGGESAVGEEHQQGGENAVGEEHQQGRDGRGYSKS